MKEQSMMHRKTAFVFERDELQSGIPVIMADSIEVMENYYRDKIKVLESSLTRLNVLEHSREISFLCREIAHAKKLLRNLFMKKKI